MKARYRGVFPRRIIYDRALSTPTGAVRRRNVTETVTTIAVPLVAALLRAWLVDSVELFAGLLHLALVNFNTMAKLVMNISTKGPNE